MIVPPVWRLFTYLPGGVRLWQWVVTTLHLQPEPFYINGHLNRQRDYQALIPSLAAPDSPIALSKLCDLPEFDHTVWTAVAQDMCIATTGTERLNKKIWEYIHVVYGLKQLECLQSNARVLSVGCGLEIPMYYIANQVAQAHGVDLFDDGINLQAALAHPERHVSFPVEPGHITLHKMNGCTLAFRDNTFDIVYSLSSIEHFGGHKAAAQAMREIGRVLKPGGVAAIATELILNGMPQSDFFLIDELLRYVIYPSRLRLIGPLNLSISSDLLADAPRVDEVQRRPFIAVYWSETLYTSVMIFLKKV